MTELNLDELGIEELQIKVSGEVCTVHDLLEINPDDMSEEYANHASLLAYWNNVAVMLEDVHVRAKSVREHRYHALYRHYRDVLQGIGKVTEAKVAAEIISDQSYQVALSQEHVALYNMKILKSIVFALRVRGEMLISLGATLRQEYDITDASMKRVADVLTK